MIDLIVIRGKEGHKVYNLWDGILEDYIDQQNGRYDDVELESKAIDYAHDVLRETYGIIHENRYDMGIKNYPWIVVDKEKAFRAKMNDYRRYENDQR